MRKLSVVIPAVAVVSSTLFYADPASSQTTFRARDPGVRTGAAGAGGPLSGLTAKELEYFNASKEEFASPEDVDEGLGPTMNLDSCGGCHSQPAIGGTSPLVIPRSRSRTAAGSPTAFRRSSARTGPSARPGS